jgi:cytochrome c peroxidase
VTRKKLLTGSVVYALAVVGGLRITAAASIETPSLHQLKAQYTRPASVPFPPDNPPAEAKAKLGEMLFFDPRLSGANYISCATCHNPSFSWGDGLPRGHGMTGLPRRTPTIFNTAWAELLMWDGRKASLEDQVLGPMSTPAEMNQDLSHLVEKLDRIEGYRTAFTAAFPGEGISVKNVARAIATFERTVVSGTAPFDRWIAGDEKAISDSAKRGFDLFNSKANCAVCHSGWNFTDNAFHDIGLPDADVGRGAILDLPSMQHAFETPTLRDVERRAPYMHDGSLQTLREVVEHYDHRAVQRPSLSEEVKPLNLSSAEKDDLISFMLTLNGDNPPVEVPVLFSGTQTARR